MPKTSSPPAEKGGNTILISVLVIIAFLGVVAIVVSVVVLKRKKGGTSQSNPGTHQKMENEIMKHIEEEIHTCEFTTENEKCESDNVDEVSPLLSSKECTNSDDPDKGLQLISTKDTQREPSSSNGKENTRGLEDTQKEPSTSNEKDNTRGLEDESMHRVATSMETGNSVPDSDLTVGKHTATFQTGMARDVIKTILDTPNGVDEYQHVLMTLLHMGLEDGRLLKTLLKENGHIFHLLEHEDHIMFVVPYLFDVQICNDYQKSSLSGKCEKRNCESFHICISFMKGICKKSDCEYSHTYSDAHNSQIKQRLHLSSYSDSEITKLLGNQYPKICSQWRCLGDMICPYLHICQSFRMACCKYGDKCKRDHSFETEHNTWILHSYNISTKSIWSGSDLAKRLVLAKT